VSQQSCFPPILVEIGQVVHEKKICKGFCYIKLCPLRAWPFVITGTSFEQTWISLTQGSSMSHIKAFRPVVHEKFLKIYQHFPYFALYWASKGASPFIWTIWIPIAKHVSHQVWLKLAMQFMRRRFLKDFTI